MRDRSLARRLGRRHDRCGEDYSKQRCLGPFCVGRSRQRRFSKRRDVRTRSSGLIEVPSNKIVLTVFRAGGLL